MRRLPLIAFVLVAAACGSGGSANGGLPTGLRQLYEYDRSSALDVTLAAKPVTERGVTLVDLSFRGSRGRRVRAFVFEPARKGRFPAVIYQHGSGQNRSEFAPEAFKLARRGAVAILLDEPWVRGGLSGGRDRVAQTVRQNYVDNVVDVRRAVDLLGQRADVDAKRIGFLGHSYGAAIGGIASAIERRIVAFDLLSGGATPSRGYARLIARSQKKAAAYRRLLRTIDPVRYVGHAAPAKLFLQAAEHDELIPHGDLKAMISAASKPKKVKWYDASHALTRDAFADSARWLAGELDLA